MPATVAKCSSNAQSTDYDRSTDRTMQRRRKYYDVRRMLNKADKMNDTPARKQVSHHTLRNELANTAIDAMIISCDKTSVWLKRAAGLPRAIRTDRTPLGVTYDDLLDPPRDLPAGVADMSGRYRLAASSSSTLRRNCGPERNGRHCAHGDWRAGGRMCRPSGDSGRRRGLIQEVSRG